MEIKAFESYMRLTLAEEVASRLVTAEVTTILRNHVPNSSLTLIGSRNTGLASPMSDLDFSMSVPLSVEDNIAGHELSTRQSAKVAERSLRVVEKRLRSSAAFSRPELIHARVPLVTCKHLATGLDIQIQTLVPFQSAQEHTAAYLAELPSLRPLYILIRHSLQIRNLTTVYDGGLGSYSILMMIVTALKHSSGKFATDDLSGQLLHILDFYGNADLYRHGFSADPPRVFNKLNEAKPVEERQARLLDPQLNGIDHILQRRNLKKPYLLALQDPANDLNDLGKNAYAIKHVQATFKVAYENIPRAIEKQSLKSDSPDKGGIWSCLDWLIKADYKAFEIARSKIQRAIKPNNTKLDSSTEAVRQNLHDRANEFRGIKQYSLNREIAIQNIPSRRNITFRKYTSPVPEAPTRRQNVKPSKNPAVHIPSGNAAHKRAQIETQTFRSIIPSNPTQVGELICDGVPSDIMDERAPNGSEQLDTKSRDGKESKMRRQIGTAARTLLKERERQRVQKIAEDGTVGDVEEGGKGF